MNEFTLFIFLKGKNDFNLILAHIKFFQIKEQMVPPGF